MDDYKHPIIDPSPEFFEFVAQNINCDPSSLRLKYAGKEGGVDYSLAIDQVECRRKCRTKLSSFLRHTGFLFPSTLAAEQASHQGVARYHVTLVGRGFSVVDMTAGLGIDALTISKEACSVTAIELDPLKAEVLRHNASILGVDNMTTVCGDSIGIIERRNKVADVIFIDPARRGASNSRVYNLRECQPDIIRHLDTILSKCGRLFLKASPLLDVSQTLSDLHSVAAVRAVSVNGECKELLIEMGKQENTKDCVNFEAVNLDNEGRLISLFSFNRSGDDDIEIRYATIEDITPGSWLYEPDASVMKLAPWKELSQRYPSLHKLAPSSHLFVSPDLFPDFPGRVLRVDSVIEKRHRKTLKGLPVNIVSRNYPVSSEELRKTLGVKEGSERFLYATRLGKTPILISAIKTYTPPTRQSDC